MTMFHLILIATWTLRTVEAADDFSTPRRYVLNLGQTTWTDAQVTCQQDGGKLATLYDQGTIPDLNVSDALTSTDGFVWIGLSRESHTNWTWEWDNGDTATWYDWSSDVTGSSGNCVVANVRNPKMWLTKNCNERFPYLCQYRGGECRFVEYPDMSIAENDYYRLRGMTSDQCKAICASDVGGVTCPSFEYTAYDGKCQFNTGNMWTLASFTSSHTGWTLFHRTCNTGEIRGKLTSLIAMTSSSLSSTTSIDLSSTVFSASPSPTLVPSSSAISCSELYVTKDIYKTREVVVSRFVPVSIDFPVSRDVFVTQNVTSTHIVTETSTSILMTTSTHIITPTPVIHWPSVSEKEEDPVEELKKITEIVKEKKKILKKISVQDNRPSATYVGYVAIVFIVCTFGSIILFDLLTICKNGHCKGKRKKKRQRELQQRDADEDNDKQSEREVATAPVVPKVWDWTKIKCKNQINETNTEDISLDLQAINEGEGTMVIKDNEPLRKMENNLSKRHCCEMKHIGCSCSRNRVWRHSQWNAGDSGFEDSDPAKETNQKQKSVRTIEDKANEIDETMLDFASVTAELKERNRKLSQTETVTLTTTPDKDIVKSTTDAVIDVRTEF